MVKVVQVSRWWKRTKNRDFIWSQIIQGSSDRGLDSIDRLNPANVYDQIYYDNIQSNPSVNSSMLKFSDLTPPYTPSYSSDDVSIDHYYYRLPSPSATLIDQDTTTPNRSINSSTSNTKRELHKELIYRQKMFVFIWNRFEIDSVFFLLISGDNYYRRNPSYLTCLKIDESKRKNGKMNENVNVHH